MYERSDRVSACDPCRIKIMSPYPQLWLYLQFESSFILRRRWMFTSRGQKSLLRRWPYSPATRSTKYDAWCRCRPKKIRCSPPTLTGSMWMIRLNIWNRPQFIVISNGYSGDIGRFKLVLMFDRASGGLLRNSICNTSQSALSVPSIYQKLTPTNCNKY